MTPKKKRETFVAVDGTALAYRSHFAFINRPLTTQDGQVTSAVFGFILGLRRIREALSPDTLVVVFDPPGKTFRHEMYDDYKAQRERMPEDLRSQLPLIHRWLEASGIPHLWVDGYEADDVLATLGIRAAQDDMDARIVSNDKDLLQVVDGSLSVVQLGKASEPPRVMDPPKVEEVFGVRPDQIIDYLALTGDSSDNVPGVPGVGKKTAAKLLGEHGTAQALLDAADGMKKSKLRENLLEARETVAFSRDLVTLRTDVAVPAPESFHATREDTEALDELYDELDFQSLRTGERDTESSDTSKYRVVRDMGELEALVKMLRKAKGFALAAVGSQDDPLRADLIGLALCAREGEAAWLPLGHADGDNLPWEMARPVLGPLLEDPSCAKASPDAKRDTLLLARAGVDLSGVGFDAMLASYVLDPSRRTHDVAELARDRLRIARLEKEEVTGTGRSRVPLAEAPSADVARWGAETADLVVRLRPSLETDLDNLDRGHVYDRIELPLFGVLARMERTGVRLDVPFLETLSGRMEKELEKVQKEAWDAAGEEFNLGSPKQVAELLFGKLGLKPRGRTKTGLSTNADVLAQLADDHPVPGLVLRHREVAKLKSTYVDALPMLVHPDTRRVHTGFNQAVAATGRLSSADPNLQNVPVRTWEGREIRKAFIPSAEGRVLVSCDYSQIELRVFAHMAQDEPLLDAFREGRDIHRATAALVFGVSEDEVTADQRAQAKTVNFAVIYGMGAVNLGRSLGITTREASRWIENYFEQYPGVRAFIERTQDRAREELVVETLAGRRRPVPEIASPDHRTRSFGERIAVNTPIQGTAADIMKLAMIEIDGELSERKLDAQMILTVHDELVFDCAEDDREELVDLVRDRMSGAMELSVPLDVDAGWGANWSEAH